MTSCPHCRLDPEATPRIQDEVVASCLKNLTSPCVACQRLIKIEEKIEEMRRSLEQLLAERNELAAALNEHHDPFLTRLPVELVSHIFTLSRPFQPSLDVFEYFDEQKHIRSVLTLGQVCRNWRNIANCTPELWSVFGTTITTKNCESSLGMPLEWLGKSGGLPLFVRLHVKGLEEDYYVSHTTTEFLASITQHAQRWKVLDLTIPIELVLFFSAAVSGKPLDRVEHLSLNIDLNCSHNTRPVVLSASPQRLSVKSGWLQRIIIDWSKLTHFSGASYAEFTVPECVHLFQCAASLSTCTIGTVIAVPDTLETQGTVVTNQSLHTLQLGACDARFWDHFNFPSLRTVCLNGGSDHQSWNPFRDFLRRSDCKIRDLGIKGLEVDEVLDTLKLIPDVERLSIDGFDMADSLLSSINRTNTLFGDPQQSNPRPLPQLKALVFRPYSSCGTYTKFNWSPLVDFIRVACTSQGRQKLQSVDIVFEKHLSFDLIMDRMTLKQLLDIAGGLDLRVVDQEGSDLLGRMRRHYGL